MKVRQLVQLQYPRFYVLDKNGRSYCGKTQYEEAQIHWKFCEQTRSHESPHRIVRIDHEDAYEVDVTPRKGQ